MLTLVLCRFKQSTEPLDTVTSQRRTEFIPFIRADWPSIPEPQAPHWVRDFDDFRGRDHKRIEFCSTFRGPFYLSRNRTKVRGENPSTRLFRRNFRRDRNQSICLCRLSHCSRESGRAELRHPDRQRFAEQRRSDRRNLVRTAVSGQGRPAIGSDRHRTRNVASHAEKVLSSLTEPAGRQSWSSSIRAKRPKRSLLSRHVRPTGHDESRPENGCRRGRRRSHRRFGGFSWRQRTTAESPSFRSRRRCWPTLTVRSAVRSA